MPLSLPPYTFLMSDHTTKQLACDVAELLSSGNDIVLVEDFLGPIADGLAAMFEIDWKRDLCVPSNTNRLMLPALRESTEADVLVSLERWFVDQFGPRALGTIARQRALENREIADYSIVWRDATPTHIDGFWERGLRIAKRDMLFVHLVSGHAIGTPSLDVIVPPGASAEDVVNLIRGVL